MNLKGELLKCAKKDQDRTAISGILMKTFPDIKGWLDIKKKLKKNPPERDKSWRTLHFFRDFYSQSFWDNFPTVASRYWLTTQLWQCSNFYHLVTFDKKLCAGLRSGWHTPLSYTCLIRREHMWLPLVNLNLNLCRLNWGYTLEIWILTWWTWLFTIVAVCKVPQ